MEHITAAIEFFRANAGFSYQPGIETPEQGKERCARMLAEAESILARAVEAGVCKVEWPLDQDADPYDWDGDDPMGRWAFGCLIKCKSGRTESLWGIWEPTTAYRRLVEAELACNIMDELREASDNATRTGADQ